MISFVAEETTFVKVIFSAVSVFLPFLFLSLFDSKFHIDFLFDSFEININNSNRGGFKL